MPPDTEAVQETLKVGKYTCNYDTLLKLWDGLPLVPLLSPGLSCCVISVTV